MGEGRRREISTSQFNVPPPFLLHSPSLQTSLLFPLLPLLLFFLLHLFFFLLLSFFVLLLLLLLLFEFCTPLGECLYFRRGKASLEEKVGGRAGEARAGCWFAMILGGDTSLIVTALD
jgi:cellulose synthase/poly-beta-1,6-N-acetylglucosamine synthase-like glycosyltransferase